MWRRLAKASLTLVEIGQGLADINQNVADIGDFGPNLAEIGLRLVAGPTERMFRMATGILGTKTTFLRTRAEFVTR